jgi:LytS/YehU family sensor histidine kinase
MMQLQPHFLFNTLHAISSLMHSDIDAADRMVSRLSEYLRLTLKNVDQQEVPLRQEVDFLQRYLEIEKIRFGDRLRITLEIAPETSGARVPNLMLQPLVENAVHNGVGRSSAGGEIRIETRRNHESLIIEIRDSGPRLAEGDLTGGLHERLDSARTRLEQLYGPAGRLEFSLPQEGGFVVKLKIPFYTDPGDEAEWRSGRPS